MKAYVFPGQGSQKKGMGEELFDEFPELVERSDQVLGYSIKELCLEDKEEKLDNTQYTQPALYVVEALSYLKKIKEENVKPDYIAGHSLGEYVALFAAGVFDFATGLKLIKKRSQLMAQVSGGGMAAVVGMSEDEVKRVLEKNHLNMIDLANINTPSQIVISGYKKDIEDAKQVFMFEGASNYVLLNVSGAFHSRYMKKVAKEFDTYISQFTFNDFEIPVISNLKARPYKNNQIKNVLVKQMYNSVKWVESIRYLMGKGVEDIVQVGPSNVLTSMIRQIKEKSTPLIVNDEEATVQKSGETTVNLAEKFGSEQFKKNYNLNYAYIAGAMYRGVSSKELVVAMGKAGFMAFLGTGGLPIDEIEESIQYIQAKLLHGEAYGMNLLCNAHNPEKEDELIKLYIKYDIRNFEASAYMSMTLALVKLRINGITKDDTGNIIIKHRIIAKVSRPEIAEQFLSAPPERIVKKLLENGEITKEEAELAVYISMADDICVEADSGGHTDQGVGYVILPTIQKLRDEIAKKNSYKNRVRVGLAGGIGTPAAVASAFLMGADFVVTGSINQCTVEAGTSEVVKDMLEKINIQDTAYAPAGDMFEMGAIVQVLKRGVFFPARANKLYELYKNHNSISEIDFDTQERIQKKYFKRNFEEVYSEVKKYTNSLKIEKAERDPKYKMALIFKWYFRYTTQLALHGDDKLKVDYQVHCGPALGAFNQWVKGTELESWKNRHVDKIAIKLLEEAMELLESQSKRILNEEI
ncbi:TPA: ACP S-malonyltransferase [Streptococcus mutans]|uniref:ACP S-malonyltransferase n=1 Tax=Streptococcus mutans TaxID=1309 RepID=UPI0022852808|nr:ACP S-malonyltransferase [Streptococcus mutans]MCY7123399.1 ACP S-malonyltransferase [Streptococcus mutans]